MAKDKSEAEKRERKEAKKDKKRKAEDDGDDTPRKEKKSKRKSEVAAIEEDTAMDVDNSLVQVEGANSSATVLAIPLAALVPFANPLADDKSQKKVLKSVKKGSSRLHSTYPSIPLANMNTQQLPKPKRSSAASKNASKPSANLHPRHQQPSPPALSPRES